MSLVQPLEPRQLFAGGGLDVSFGTNGHTIVQLYSSAETPVATSATVDPQGRTIVAAMYQTKKQLRIARLTADGKLDTTFDGDGIARRYLDKSDIGALTLAVDHKGRLLVVTGPRLTRFKASGALDTKFGTGGTLVIPILNGGGSVIVDNRDRPILAGYSVGKTGNRATVIRLGERGALDTGFGSGGAFKSRVPQDSKLKKPGNAYGGPLTILPDGDYLAATGERYQYSNEGGNFVVTAATLYKLNPNGTLDESFGNKGSQTVTSKGTDVTASTSTFAAFYDGGAIVRNELHSLDDVENDYTGKTTWTRIDAAGTIADETLDLLPASIPTPRPARRDLAIVATQSDGKLILSGPNATYRLKNSFKFDPNFAPVAERFDRVFARADGTLIGTVRRDDNAIDVAAIAG